MARELTKDEFVKFLYDKNILTEKMLEILKVIYYAKGEKISQKEIANSLGHIGKNAHSAFNSPISSFVKKVCGELKIDSPKYNRDLLFESSYRDKPQRTKMDFKLKPNLKEALEICGLVNNNYSPDEIPAIDLEKYPEGAKKQITVNAYERNPIARQKCIENHIKIHKRLFCIVCEFDFEKEYGEIGKDFIHVHHLKQLSEIGETYDVDPINDLRPVCPNCHAMLHRGEKLLSIEELQDKIAAQKQK